MTTTLTLEQKTKTWWNRTKTSEKLINNWLLKQYRGEALAEKRVREFADQHDQPRARAILRTIADQEGKHARWIFELLSNRGLRPDNSDGAARYWKATEEGMTDLATTAALAAHAEGMRLARIRVIVEDPFTPEDIKTVFSKILPEEEFHEKGFAEICGEEAYEATREFHKKGLEVLGLSD